MRDSYCDNYSYCQIGYAAVSPRSNCRWLGDNFLSVQLQPCTFIYLGLEGTTGNVAVMKY